MTLLREAHAPAVSARPLCQLVLFLGLLLAGYLFVHGGAWPQGQAILNVAGPASLIAACLITAARVLAANRLLLLTPLPWFLLACGTFFGIGSLAYLFADSDTIADMNHLWFVDAGGLWRTNVLNTVGILTILCAFLAMLPIVGPRAPVVAADSESERSRLQGAKMALAVFLGIGLPMRYLLALPHELGQLGFVLPGSLLALQEFVPIGLLLLGYLSVHEGRVWFALLVPLLAAELPVAFLQFNKTAILLVATMPPLGRYLAHGRTRELAVSGAICFLLYVVSAPIVASCRHEAMQLAEDPNGRISLADRRDIVEMVIHARLTGEPLAGQRKQSWWSRLCYSHPQAFVMDHYDTGSPGDSFQGAIYSFVPRFLWPEKPIVTDVGVDFTQLCLGHRYSSTSIGIFGEAYWNGGWPMVLLACGYIGVLFAVLSRLNLMILTRADWLLLPCAFWGLKIGFRIDGWFVADYVGAVVLYFAYLGVFALLRHGFPALKGFVSPAV